MDNGYTIAVQGGGQVFTCKHNQFILDAMLKTRCGPIHYGCCGGGCGVCKARVVSGRFEVVKSMSRAHVTVEEQLRGIVLLCCVQPRSNLVLSQA